LRANVRRETVSSGDCPIGARAVNTSATGFDYERYRKLLAEATDERKRLALIQLLIDEKARDRLAAALRARPAESTWKPKAAPGWSAADARPHTRPDTWPDAWAKPALPAPLKLSPKPDLRLRDILTLGADFLRKGVAQADRPVEYRTSER
jgi:hypothetical protein